MHKIVLIFASALVSHAALQIDGAAPALGPGTVAPEGDTQVFSISASSDRTILYRWFVDDTELGAETASSFNYTPGFDSIIHVDLAPLERPLAVRCEVRTDQDSAQTLTWNITLQDTNRPPVIQGSVDITPSNRAAVSDNLICLVTGNIVDPDPEDSVQLMYAWTSGDKFILSCPIGSTEDTLQTENTEAGETWTCSVTALDQLQLQSTPVIDSVTINNPPTVPSILLRNDHGVETASFFSGNSIEAFPSGHDADGDVTSFIYSWLRDGDDAGSSESTLYLDEASFGFGDETTLIVHAMDAYDIGPPTTLTTTLGWRFRFDWTSPNCDDLSIGQHGDASDGADALDVLAGVADTASLLPGRPGDFGMPQTVDIRALGDEFHWTVSVAAGQAISWNTQDGVPGSTLTMYEIDRHGYVLGAAIDLGDSGGIPAAQDARKYVVRLSERLTEIVAWQEGWNLVGSPIRLAQAAIADVFANIDPAAAPLALGWNGSALLAPAEFANQKGFWIHVPKIVQFPLHGTLAFQNILELDAGWNLISVTATGPTRNFPERCSDFWRWDIALQSFRAAPQLEPGNGYWINSKSPVTLDLTE
ncbi:MAG: hypothetical protein ACI8W8_001478 [Rhodothermales bacterium]|jgi:hypothetical protein